MTTPSLYLNSISLRNFATFENQIIKFHSGFNGIVGETGSGKSLILDAFQLLLGSRSDKKLVRRNSECAIIEGTFKVTNNQITGFFDKLGFPIEDNSQIVIKRIIYANGKSKSFLNHMNCPANTLAHISKTFVDLVGQFENQKLSSSEYQLFLIDQYSNVEYLLKEYQTLYKKFQSNEVEIIKLENELKEKERREDYLNFQLSQFDELNPSISREEELISIKTQLLNKESLNNVLEEIKNLSSEGDFNILNSLKSINRSVQSNPVLFDKKTQELIETIYSLFEDFSFLISSKDFRTEENLCLEDILEELDKYQKLKRKFNVETNSLDNIYQCFKRELQSLTDINIKLDHVKKEYVQNKQTLEILAEKLHREREKASTKFSKEITKNLEKLNMRGSTFSVLVEKNKTLSSNGFTKIKFLAETNPGEGFYNIKDIASGGELSRILLTLRQIVASEDSISIFFFDEIDTGIGGETATKIAEALKKVSLKGQVLAITHLAQIAKSVDEIIFVDKKSYSIDNELRTVSFVKNKSGKSREKVLSTLAGI